MNVHIMIYFLCYFQNVYLGVKEKEQRLMDGGKMKCHPNNHVDLEGGHRKKRRDEEKAFFFKYNNVIRKYLSF